MKIKKRTKLKFNNDEIRKTDFIKLRRTFRIPDRSFTRKELNIIKRIWIAENRLMDCDELHDHNEKCYRYDNKKIELLNRLVTDCLMNVRNK